MEFSVGPVGAESTGGVLVLDCGVDLAATEEGETPVKHAGVWTGQSIGYADCAVGGQSVGVGHGESECAAGTVCSLVGCRRSLGGGRAVPKSEIRAGGKSGGGCVQKIDGVRTGVQEGSVGVSEVIESGGDISSGGIKGIDGLAA